MRLQVPQVGFSRHIPADEISNLTGNDGASRLTVPNLPEQAEAGTMPGHDGFRFHDDQGRAG